MRIYRPGDSWLRHAITEPVDFAVHYWGRLRCHLGYHNRVCEGRRDHPKSW